MTRTIIVEWFFLIPDNTVSSSSSFSSSSISFFSSSSSSPYSTSSRSTSTSSSSSTSPSYFFPSTLPSVTSSSLYAPSCQVIAASERGDNFYLVFNNSDLLWEYSFQDSNDAVLGIFSSEKDLFSYNQDLDGRYPDAACQFGDDQVFFFGT